MGNAYVRFQTNPDHTVTDLLTGLTWDSREVGLLSWDEAGRVADLLYLGGKNDWRLPTVGELSSLLHKSGQSEVLTDLRFFPFAVANRYWTCELRPDKKAALFVSFSSGRTGHISKVRRNFVRCVRGDFAG